MSLLELLTTFGPRIFFALLCGGIIGLERELKNKVAGIKTNMLICVGSALYTSMSVLIPITQTQMHGPGDPGRIAAQIVSGIGFLGGGAIIQARGTIFGLTTAATIWVVAALGIAVGLGYYSFSVVTSFVVVFVLTGVTFLENSFLGRSNSFLIEITIDEDSARIRRGVNQALDKNELILDDFDIVGRGAGSVLRVRYKGYPANHKKFVLDLWTMNGVREVKQH